MCSAAWGINDGRVAVDGAQGDAYKSTLQRFLICWFCLAGPWWGRSVCVCVCVCVRAYIHALRVGICCLSELAPVITQVPPSRKFLPSHLATRLGLRQPSLPAAHHRLLRIAETQSHPSWPSP